MAPHHAFRQEPVGGLPGTTWRMVTVVQRTQIYLADDDLALLDEAAARTGATRSELIRRAVRERYGARDDWEAKRAALRSTAGAWKNWPTTGEEYVASVRGDLDDRLEQLGW